MPSKKTAITKTNETVAKICSAAFRPRNWRDGLSPEDLATVNAVKTEVVENSLPKATVARSLIEALDLKVSVKLVADWFRN